MDSGPSIPLSELGLSIRPYNALRRHNITTVEQLIGLSTIELLSIRGIGEKAAREIRDKLQVFLNEHHLEPKKEEPLDEEVDSVEQGLSGFALTLHPAIPLDEVSLSSETRAFLNSYRITTINQLVVLLDEGIEVLPGMHEEMKWEIETALRRYLRSHPHLRVHTTGFLKAQPSVEDRGHSIIPATRLAEILDREIPLGDIPVTRLALSYEYWRMLRAFHIKSVLELCQQPREYWWTNSPTIVQRLEDYILWVTRQNEKVLRNEVKDRGLNPFYRASLAHHSLDSYLHRWLSYLAQRDRLIIALRYGLTGIRATLQVVGEKFGLTRERVRQIQERAKETLLLPQAYFEIRPLVALLTHLIEQAGGIISEEELIFQVENAMIVGNINVLGAIHLIFDQVESVKWLRECKGWGLSDYPLDIGLEIQRQARQLLEQRRAPIAMMELSRQVWELLPQNQEKSKLSLSFIEASLRAHPDIYIDQYNHSGLRKWKRSHTDKIIIALRMLGTPSHYEEITDKVRELVPSTAMISAHNIHAILGRREDIFVRVGHGIFGLKEWGLHDDGNVANAAYRVLKEAGRPLHFDVITDQVLQTWRVKRTSVYAALGQDDRFVNLGRGFYWLKECMEKQTQEEAGP